MLNKIIKWLSSFHWTHKPKKDPKVIDMDTLSISEIDRHIDDLNYKIKNIYNTLGDDDHELWYLADEYKENMIKCRDRMIAYKKSRGDVL